MNPILLILAATSAGLFFLQHGAAHVALSRRARSLPKHSGLSADTPGTHPAVRRVSILKPVSGLDEDLLGNLESFLHVEQSAVQVELLIGLASLEDPAFRLVHAFVSANPTKSRLVLTDADTALNPKVAQLIGLLKFARGDLVVVSDANVRVSPDYLTHLLEPFRDEQVGLVSSLIVSNGEKSVGAMIEATQLGGVIAPGILATSVLTGTPIAIGKSLAVRRHVLEQVGGFQAVSDVLAEDHVLAGLVQKAGYRVELSMAPVEDRNVRCSLSKTIERHSRWAKMRRSITVAGFVAEPLLSPFAMTSALFIFSPSQTSLSFVALALVIQAGFVELMLRRLGGQGFGIAIVPLEAIRSVVLATCWFHAASTRRVMWRGHPFLLLNGTKVKAIHTQTRATQRVRES